MLYNKDLAKRFVSDYKLPIPIINEEYFFYYLDLYEEDYASMTKYKNVIKIIEEKYNGDCNDFLKSYYDVRENIIQSVLSNPAYIKFNTMDMNEYAIKNKPSISSNNIYNQDNIGDFFISVDLKKANFQTLKNIDPEIVFGADTYEDFIGKFTDLDYIKESKYTREVIWGKLNPKRHITAEKYFICKIYEEIIKECPGLNGKAVSLSNDEVIFKTDFVYFNDKLTCFAIRNDIEKIAKRIGFDVHVEFFHLRGYNLVFKESRSVRKTFYFKEYIFTDASFKLISAPLPYHALIYKLFKGIPTEEIDYHFDYEGMNARFYEEFDIEEINNQFSNNDRYYKTLEEGKGYYTKFIVE